MFKVPDWGSDIPASNVDLATVFNKKNKNKNANNEVNPKLQTRLTKRKNKNSNEIRQPKNGFVKKHNNHTILSKDDHIKNRMLKRSLKNSTEHVGNTSATTGSNHNFNGKLKANVSINGISGKLNNKSLKSRKRIEKNNITNKSNNQKIPEVNNEKDIVPGNDSDAHKNQKSRKRKLKENDTGTNESDIREDSINMQTLNTDEPDKILVNAKRKKLNEKIKNDDIEDDLFGNEVSVQSETKNRKADKLNNNNHIENINKLSSKEKAIRKKKEQIRVMLKRDSNRNIIKTNGDKLRMRMMDRLKAAQFRYLNEKLYTSSGSESQELFKSDPSAFQTYHEGYQQQVKKWPVNPLDLIVKRIQNMPKTHLIADMGCGEAALSKRVANTVRSFDLVATVPGVEACNMAHTPLLTASMDAVVYCLALMGTDLTQYLLEANRVLKIGGHLLIAEVESRFENVDAFSSDVQRLGFSLKKMDKTHKVFFFMEFTKVRDAPAKKNKLPVLTLKPCLYKRR